MDWLEVGKFGVLELFGKSRVHVGSATTEMIAPRRA